MSTYAFRVKTWLSSTWHVKVPDPWLEACINWILEEYSGSSLSQAEINKQVFEQWLLADLRDLDFPVLPAGILNSLKFELNGFYAIQIDSLVDVSLPAYSQLQNLRGRGNGNDQVTAKTQVTQQPWEAKPSRMLMLQLSDGTQNVQGMEYQSVPALHVGLSPGTKILLQGTINCRLGVLLLKPENVKVLGGEVEALLEENSQVKVISRLIGIEENTLPQRTTGEGQSAVRQQDAIEQALGLSDEDLLASLNENDELTLNNNTVPESGYHSRSDSSSYSASVPQLDRELHMPRTRQSHIPASNETNQVIVRDDFEEVYDLDDDLFLEEEIQRELEEISMNQTETINRNQNVSTERFTPTAITPNVPSTSRSVSIDLDSPPFTYLSVFVDDKSGTIQQIKLKAFIVTLIGNLTSSSGFWSVKAKISDGTGYMDVEISNDVLIKLIGFSVPEMKKLKKDPTQQSRLKSGILKCQAELTDFCGIMTISCKPPTVVALEDVTDETRMQLIRRLT
ncbi:PREDICTED: recQ-mediated genome instability protein 1 [Nanorana parkeri]|uniref:recQ-mediated genome instability protein 1 n=1 Tax=Nanorana parkeri TaxID=125878 RepID=UPI000853FE57|nr:PREDICTED: recQ-mediated genome instability protein 1 [Nanorana parkeri]